MAYPTYMILEDSEATVGAGIEAARASNGKLKIRKLYDSDKTDFTVVHMLTRAERDALQAHYLANVEAQFSLTWPGDGATYTCCYAAAPQYSRRGQYYRATVRLAQV